MKVSERVKEIIDTFVGKSFEITVHIVDGTVMTASAMKLRYENGENDGDIHLMDEGNLFSIKIDLHNIKHYLTAYNEETNLEELRIRNADGDTFIFNLIVNKEDQYTPAFEIEDEEGLELP